MPSSQRLKARLDRLCAAIGPADAGRDPVRFPRLCGRDDDREVAGFVAAALAYGRQAQILRSVEAVLSWLGPRPAREVLRLDLTRARRDLGSFAHRFNTGGDVAQMLMILRRLLEKHGSLNAAFLEGYEESHQDIGPALTRFCQTALQDEAARPGSGGVAGSRAGVRFFFPSPEDGSACKRLNMFLRWMVRRDGVDLGLWSGIPTSKLVMPLDTHVARVSRELGLSRRKSPDWTMALEVTATLRSLDPEDPVRYDFALFNWGMQRLAARTTGGVIAR